MRSTDPPTELSLQAASSPTIRASIDLDNARTKRFALPKKKNFEPQYAHVYFSRLKRLTPYARSSAKATFGEQDEKKIQYANRIVDLSANSEIETVIVGVVFRQMKAKPSILAEYDVPSHELIPAPPDRGSSSYVSESDSIFIEDEYGRCAVDLTGLGPTAPLLSFCTGFVVALKGREDKATGAFKVNGYAVPGQAPQPRLPLLPKDKYICIVSGLSFGHAMSNSLATELLLEFLRGNSGDESEEAASASIAQLIVAGNLIPHLEDSESGATAILAAHRPVKGGEKERVAAPIAEVDRFLSACASALPVAVMPGDADPSTYLLPQQPFHRCLLPSSFRNANLARVTNPYECAVDGRIVLGSSGQPVMDMALYEVGETDIDASTPPTSVPSGSKVLDILELMLSNRHIAPTTPDTLASYPFADGDDPFILDETPHVFFAGNQKEYASRLVRTSHGQTQSSADGSMDIDGVRGGEKTVRVVSVPRFDETGQATLINLRTLECSVREFALTM